MEIAAQTARNFIVIMVCFGIVRLEIDIDAKQVISTDKQAASTSKQVINIAIKSALALNTKVIKVRRTTVDFKK